MADDERMTADEIDTLLESVIMDMQVFAADRCGTMQEYADVEADIAALERLGEQAKEVTRLEAIIETTRSSEEFLIKYFDYLSIENSRLRARRDGTNDDGSTVS